MTRQPPRPAVRRAARLLALVPAIVVTTATGAAWASPPESWESTPHVSGLHVLLLLGAAPLALFVLITLLVLLPGMSKGTSYSTTQVWRGEPEWFGGPSEGLEAVHRGAPAAVGAAPADAAATTGGSSAVTEPVRGGASGRW